MKVSPEVTEKGPGSDHFGVIGRTRLMLPKGRWVLRVMSDDGVRVTVDGRAVIENWTWHGPSEDRTEFVQDEDREVEVGLEYFEIDGAAILRLDIERVE